MTSDDKKSEVLTINITNQQIKTPLQLTVMTTHHQKAEVGVLKESGYLWKALAVSQAVVVMKQLPLAASAHSRSARCL